jgi:hypothetical protein
MSAPLIVTVRQTTVQDADAVEWSLVARVLEADVLTWPRIKDLATDREYAAARAAVNSFLDAIETA